MSDRDILEHAISKAIEGGWDKTTRDYILGGPADEMAQDAFIYDRWESIIFNPGFASSLWPNEWERRYKLAMMVNSENPVKYLGDHS